MKRLIAICFLSVSVCVIGCTWFSAKKPASLDSTQGMQSRKIVDSARLKQGGKLFIFPFKAGEGIVANDELDKISLRIVKGIADILLTSETNFVILDGARAKQADIIIKGYITKKSESAKYKRYILQTPRYELTVEGKMVDAKSNIPLAVFTENNALRSAMEGFHTLAKTIGEDIGEFILSGIR